MDAYTTNHSREAFMQRIGKVVFDGAMVRLIGGLTEEQVRALNYAIESCDSFGCVIEYVERSYPQFGTFLEEEQKAFVEAYLSHLRVAQ